MCECRERQDAESDRYQECIRLGAVGVARFGVAGVPEICRHCSLSTRCVKYPKGGDVTLPLDTLREARQLSGQTTGAAPEIILERRQPVRGTQAGSRPRR